jgi:hypothetical protein
MIRLGEVYLSRPCSGSPLGTQSEWFYSFDRQQLKLAQAVKLKVNPLP